MRRVHQQLFQKRYTTSEIDAAVAQIKTYLDAHYSQNLTLESISKALNMNPSYVSHGFKAEMNILIPILPPAFFPA